MCVCVYVSIVNSTDKFVLLTIRVKNFWHKVVCFPSLWEHGQWFLFIAH